MDDTGKITVVGFFSLPAELDGGVAQKDIYVRHDDWEFSVGGPSDDQANAVALDEDGNVLVAGAVGSGEFGDHQGATDAFLVKYSKESGALMWSRQFGSACDDAITALAVHSDGTIVVTGYFGGASEGGADDADCSDVDAFLQQYDKDGNLTDSTAPVEVIDSHGDDHGQAVTWDADGNIIVVGHTTGGFVGAALATDFFVRRYTRAWEEQWTGQFGTDGWEKAQAVTIVGNGDVVVAGTTRGLPNDDPSFGLIQRYRIDGTPVNLDGGAIVGEETLTGTKIEDVSAVTAMVTAPNGHDVVLAGNTKLQLPPPDGPPKPPEEQSFDAFTAVYSLQKGQLVWARRVSSATTDTFEALAITHHGQVAVAGFTHGRVENNRTTSDPIDWLMAAYQVPSL